MGRGRATTRQRLRPEWRRTRRRYLMWLRKGAVMALTMTAVVFGLAACGGDDDDGGGAATTPAATSTAPSTTSTGTSTTAGTVDPSKPPVLIAINALKIPAVDLLTPYTVAANQAAKA